MAIKDEIIKQVQALEGVQLDHPFAQYPSYQVFRHQQNSKWFGLVMTVENEKLGLPSTETMTTDIIDVKADPEMISILRNSKGYLPAYHMNKNNWLSIMLDGTVPEKQIFQLIEDSYALTKGN